MDEPSFGKRGVPADSDARVRSELRGGERLLWVGQPRPDYFARQGLPVALIGVGLTALLSAFLVKAVSGMLFGGGHDGDRLGASDLPAILPFVLIGLALLSSPYWLWRRAKRTFYALTDRRAILWEAGSFKSVEVRSYGPEELAGMYRVEYPGGGDLVFEEVHSIRRASDDDPITFTGRHGFMGIKNVREVEELIRKTLLTTGD